jgi:hypothetical protein
MTADAVEYLHLVALLSRQAERDDLPMKGAKPLRVFSLLIRNKAA